MKFILFFLTLGCFFISPNLLYMIGSGYGASGGGLAAKIHPCTYVAFAAVALQVALNTSNKLNYIKDSELLRYVFLVFGLAIYCVVMGYVVSPIFVTLMTPLLVVALLQHCDRNYIVTLGILIRLVLAANAALGIVELLGGDTLLERVAADVVIQSESRAIGFVGHPLPSSLLSALMIVFLVRNAVEGKFGSLRLFELAMHFAGLMAFGGRLALVMAVLLSVFALFFGRAKTYFRGRKRKAPLTLRFGLIAALMVGCVFLLQSDFAENTLSRFVVDNDGDASSVTRFSALLMLSEASAAEWLFGVSEARRIALMSAFDTDFGIENTWISWIFNFGALWTVALGWIFIKAILKLIRGRSAALKYMSVLFLVAITGAQGLGGKTLMLTWFVMMLICLDPSNPRVLVNRVSR